MKEQKETVNIRGKFNSNSTINHRLEALQNNAT